MARKDGRKSAIRLTYRRVMAPRGLRHNPAAVTNARSAMVHMLPVGLVSLSVKPVPVRNPRRALVTSGMQFRRSRGGFRLRLGGGAPLRLGFAGRSSPLRFPLAGRRPKLCQAAEKQKVCSGVLPVIRIRN